MKENQREKNRLARGTKNKCNELKVFRSYFVKFDEKNSNKVRSTYNGSTYNQSIPFPTKLNGTCRSSIICNGSTEEKEKQQRLRVGGYSHRANACKHIVNTFNFDCQFS